MNLDHLTETELKQIVQALAHENEELIKLIEKKEGN